MSVHVQLVLQSSLSSTKVLLIILLFLKVASVFCLFCASPFLYILLALLFINFSRFFLFFSLAPACPVCFVWVQLRCYTHWSIYNINTGSESLFCCLAAGMEKAKGSFVRTLFHLLQHDFVLSSLSLVCFFHANIWPDYLLSVAALKETTMADRFDCDNCKESLYGRKYIQSNDSPYCIPCYDSLFSNTCDECKELIGHDARVRRCNPFNSKFYLFLNSSTFYQLCNNGVRHIKRTQISLKPFLLCFDMTLDHKNRS